MAMPSLYFILEPLPLYPNGMHFTEAEFLDEIQTKVLIVFLLAIHSHLTALLGDFYLFQLTQPLTVSTVQLLYTVMEKG
jgi:hypothetical protein